jgi:hypothetical protein
MKNIGGQSRFIGFFDECGDHSMEKIDPDFPLFVLALVVVERTDYAERIIPALSRLKLRYWIHEGINLHSRDIRKAIGAYSFLQNPKVRPIFMSKVSDFMTEMPFTLFLTCIRKQAHADRYGPNALSPYNIALEFTMERLLHFLQNNGETELPIVAEARGKKEDAELERVFFRILSQGTGYHAADQFKRLTCPLVFRSKKDNIAGVQIADLCAYPCARHVLNRPNPAYDIVKRHLYNQGGVSGWKVFP